MAKIALFLKLTLKHFAIFSAYYYIIINCPVLIPFLILILITSLGTEYFLLKILVSSQYVFDCGVKIPINFVKIFIIAVYENNDELINLNILFRE